MAMGLISLNFSIKIIFSWDMEVINGDSKMSSNTFFWNVVIQNSPGTTSYDTTMPRLYIWDSIRGVISAACNTYVDDLRSIASTQSLAKESTHQVDITMGYLCLQDDTRKRWPVSQTPV